jgi:uncharacterized Fe-S cluster protein YjdI
MAETIEYNNGEITINWKPSLCIHSGICWKGLPGVFDPQKKPWIKQDGADTKKITDIIDKCPSRALSYNYNNKPNKVMEDNINKIEIAADGPILIYGTIEIKHSDGRIETIEKTAALCRCGASANKPFCDGAHRYINFKG